MAIILVGEGFRLGGQGNRNRDSNESYEAQKSACLSHVRFCEDMAAKNFEVEIFVESYNTRHESDLRSWYGSRLKNYSTRGDLVGLQRLSLDALSRIDSSYRCVLVCRIDLILKKMFSDVFDPTAEKVIFPSACWVNGHMHGSHPRVSDTMVQIPQRFVDRMKGGLHICHEAWHNMVNFRILACEDLGLMLDTYHDSDSAKDYNPLYSIANRHVSTVWRSMGYVVGSNNTPVYTQERKKFPDWSPRMLLPADKRGVGLDNAWEWWHKDPGAGFFFFIGAIEFSKHEIFGQTVEIYNNRDQRYWFMDGDKMVIMDETKKVSSVMKKVSEDCMSGDYEFRKGVTFMIRKIDTKEWN